jgi:RNA polymerase sigma factor (sigma-70 family)
VRKRTRTTTDSDDSVERVVAIEKYAPQLHRYLLRRLQHREDAKDLLQQVFMRWWQAPKPLDVRQPEAYLYRIASNVLSEFVMWSSRQRVTYDSLTAEELAERLPSEADAPTDLSEQLGVQQQLERILAQIPPMYRAVLVLRTRDDMSVTEIAEALQISANTVRVYLYRALAACRSADWDR